MNLMTLVLAAILAVLQTTWFSPLKLWGAFPDLVLVVLSYRAHLLGVQRAQIGGFIVGIVEDALSVSPIGFFAVVRSVHSAVLGFTKDAVRADNVVTPIVLIAVAYVVKTFGIVLVAAVIGLTELHPLVFSAETAVEFGLTAFVAPFMFAVLNRVRKRISERARL